MTQIRKYFTTIPLILQAITIVAVGFLTDSVMCVLMIILSMTAGSFVIAGFIGLLKNWFDPCGKTHDSFSYIFQ